MKEYNVTITEVQVYDVTVYAESEEEAEEKALECYGHEGEIGYTNATVTDVEG